MVVKAMVLRVCGSNGGAFIMEGEHRQSGRGVAATAPELRY
ncbi:MAG: hypothetical protein ACYS1C_04715 [Planctomycetota bacterium]